MKVPLPHLVTGLTGIAMLALLPVLKEHLPPGESHPAPALSPAASSRNSSTTYQKRKRGESRDLWKSPRVRTGFSVGYQKRYSDYLAILGLTEEEHHYFCSLLSERCVASGILDLQWVTSPDEEKPKILQELDQMLAGSDDLIRQFLNHEGDFQLFLDYEARLPDLEALAQVNFMEDLEEEDYTRLLEELHQARIQTEEATGWRFESWRFLAGQQNLALLRALREETDRKLKARLPDILPQDKEELFLTQWNALREEQEARSKFTLGTILKERS